MTEEKKEVSSKDQIFLKSLDADTSRKVVVLYAKVNNTPINSFVAKDLIATMQGTSDKSIFNLGVLAGQNEVIRQLKSIIDDGSK